MDSEATVSGAFPMLACHRGEGVRTDSVVRGVRLDPTNPSIGAPRRSGFADGRVYDSPAHRHTMRAVGLGRVVVVKTAQASWFRE